MDFGDEDELDFEEDLPENESTRNDDAENREGEKAGESDLNGNDQYLQIDCAEDEEDLLSKIASETETTENTVQDAGVNKKTQSNEEIQKSDEEEKPVKNHPNQRRNFGKINRNHGKERRFGVPLYKTSGHAYSNRWRPGNNFKRLPGQNAGQRSNHLKGFPLRYPNHLHHFSQNYLQNQHEFVSLLGLSAAKNKNIQQVSNGFAQCSNPMLEVNKNLVGNGVLGQCNDPVMNQLHFNDFCRLKGILAQKLAVGANNQNLPVRCPMNGFQTNFSNRCFNEEYSDTVQEPITRHILPEEEKELIKSKKEARMLRFMNDQTARKENTTEKSLNQSLNIEDEYFRKMEEQKRKREEIFSLKEKQKQNHDESMPERMKINKEVFLKKENPFENFKPMENNVKIQIKQEKEGVNVIQNPSSLPVEQCVIKKEMESPVKFIRTVSKSFEELGLSKSKSGLYSGTGNESGSGLDLPLEKVRKAPLVDACSQTQTEPHLTGCIVKVFNVSPLITASDVLALCSNIGTVREVKLNFPKENSVAIRFSEPQSAENFFKLYNGRVVWNHILNVITV